MFCVKIAEAQYLKQNLIFSGRQQADLTGKRLASLNINWDLLVRSTMTRAQETAAIIAKHLPQDLEIKDCQLLEEGAPIPPEPAVGHWRPEPKVSFSVKLDFKNNILI